ncbi:MAG: beta-ketoacyl synthase chain length factor [Fibrobacter sp.]|nr:beta-ketoacyl synthase chain length factor [Fibrobacter sp.]MBQ5465217.1 beta-ketoacyl synthase chain length factor [Fibrobacter sp.]
MSDNNSRKRIYIERFASFVPTESSPKPDVSFVPMLTRRRLSYISRMVVLVSDQVSRGDDGCKLAPCKVTFASQFGEISQQLKISQTLIDTGTVSPAHFSLSVFNASIANASILETNDKGYSAVFSGKEAFTTGLMDCIAALETENASSRTFIFADELIPETYAPVAGVPYPNAVCAIALRLTTDESKADHKLGEFDVKQQLSLLGALHNNFDTAAEQALAFLCAINMRKA